MTNDTQEIVAAILTAAKIQKHGIAQGRRDEAGYLIEYQRMLDEVRKTILPAAHLAGDRKVPNISVPPQCPHSPPDIHWGEAPVQGSDPAATPPVAERVVSALASPLASVHPETLSFWNHWANSDFWGEGPGGFG